jgi:DNA-binding Lrp family transcriptional regulator
MFITLTAESSSGARKGWRSVNNVQLDEVDQQIVSLLMAEGRLANNALAARVGIAPSTCLNRLRLLRQRGVIRGVHADIDLPAIGRSLQAMIAVRLQADARSRIEPFERYLASLPGVLNVYFLAGPDDFLVHVAVQDPPTLRAFVVDHLSAAQDVAMTETSLIFDHLRPGTLPAVIAPAR